jgi:CRP-like cAMP-binding protein
VALFKGQSDDLLRFLTAKSEVIQVCKGDLICKKGTQPYGLYCVLEGKVKISVISHQGNERVLEIVQDGGMFGEASMIREEPCALYAQALDKTRLVFFRRGAVIAAIRHFPEFALSLIGGMSDRMQRLVRDVEVCCLQPAADRVVSFILDHARPDGDGRASAEVRLPAGKAIIASSLNLTPETFSRELHQLVGRGLIDVEKKTIRVHDLAALAVPS